MLSIVHIELGIVLVMAVMMLVVAWTRHLNYKSEGKSSGLTKNVVRVVALVFVLPITGILTIEGIISPAATTGIYGATLGYLFAGFDLSSEDE